MVQYSKINSSNIAVNGLRRPSGTLRFLENKSLTKNMTRKHTYYMTIVSLGAWLLISNIPYHSFTIWEWIMLLKSYDFFKSNLIIRLQAVSSVLFNSNHYVYIFVYIFFHRTFRFNLKVLFIKFLVSINLKSAIKSDTLINETSISQIRNNYIASRNILESFEITAESNIIPNKIDDLNMNNLTEQYNINVEQDIVFIDDFLEEAL